MARYQFAAEKQPYLCFLGRICPVKGAHHAIAIAKLAGLRLKIAGEVQPMFQGYFDEMIRPLIDGRQFEFLGEADHAMKNELLRHATALLFPIEWEEPFGLVMIEAMACGTPVIAFPGGSVEEVVKDGVSGYVCRNVEEAEATGFAGQGHIGRSSTFYSAIGLMDRFLTHSCHDANLGDNSTLGYYDGNTTTALCSSIPSPASPSIPIRTKTTSSPELGSSV